VIDHLYRDVAPISASTWKQIEEEATSRLTTYLAARKLVDFSGPHGWEHSATNLGRTRSIDSPAGGMVARQRRVLPLVEFRSEFTVSREELDDAGRGALDIDLADLDAAVKRMAIAENAAVFHGYGPGDIRGLSQASAHEVLSLPLEFEAYPMTVARAVNTLLSSGIAGPYGLAIGPDGYTGIIESTEHGGYLVLDHLRNILGGPVVWAPGVEGAVVMSLRGGDFVLEVGQDLSIGYLDHDAAVVRLFLEESFNFRVLEPEATVALVYAGAGS
jgi:uncharacterized linocin/CFP29 family protein